MQVTEVTGALKIVKRQLLHAYWQQKQLVLQLMLTHKYVYSAHYLRASSDWQSS